MALFPEYQISINDPIFPRVYARWTMDIMQAMFDQSPSMSIIENLEFWIGTHNKPIEEAIRVDFKKMVSKYRGTNTDHVILCYDSPTFSMEEIWLETRQIMRQKRQKDFEIRLISAFNLTQTIDIDLLDYQLPDINLILMNFTAAKELI